jgi:hypothetical protein
MQLRRPDIEKAEELRLKSGDVLNKSGSFAEKAAAITQMRKLESDSKTEAADVDQATNPFADEAPTLNARGSVSTDSSDDKVATPAATSPVSKKTRSVLSSSLASMQSAIHRARQHKEEKGVIVPHHETLSMKLEEIQAINQRIQTYMAYLNHLKETKSLNKRNLQIINYKIDIARTFLIELSGTNMALTWEKFTDNGGFSTTANVIKEHRNKSFSNKYHSSEGAIFINDIENLLPACYATELKVRRLRNSLLKYKAHLSKISTPTNFSNEKLEAVNKLLEILSLSEDTSEALELFNVKWKTSPAILSQHRNKLFENIFKSEGQDLIENINSILNTGQDSPKSSYRQNP